MFLSSGSGHRVMQDLPPHAIVRKAFTDSQLPFGEFVLYIAKRDADTVRSWLGNLSNPPEEVLRFFRWFNGLTAFERRAFVDGAIAEHHSTMWTPPPPSRRSTS